jgi:hypothetical protein
VNLTTCGHLPRFPETGTWYRAIQPQYLGSPLHRAHTSQTRSRFNGGPLLIPANRFEILYFADNPLVATFEYGALFGSLVPGKSIPNPNYPYVMLSVQMVLHSIVDLSDVSKQNLVDISAQELTGDWDGYTIRNQGTNISGPNGLAPTQILGEALKNTGVEGFKSISAKVPYHRTLMVFSQNLQSNSSILFRDQSGKILDKIP